MQDIVFRPYLGISNSPLSENAYSICIDNDTLVGTARINRATINVPTEVGESEPIYPPVKFSKNYCLDSNGGFWKYTTTNGGQWELISAGSGNGNDFVVFNNYAFVCRGGQIDRIKISNESVTSGWKTDAGEVMVVGKDDIIYIGNNNIIRTINSSFTYNDEALNLPKNEVITSLAELNVYIAIGTRSGQVYLWDRVSQSFELPTQLPNKVEMLIPVNNVLFALVDNGDLYQTNGSTCDLVRKFPLYTLSTEDDSSFTFNPNAWRVEGSKIYIGFGTTTAVSPIGVYSYDYKDGDYKVEHIISTGAIGETASIQITALSQYDNQYPYFWIGWKKQTLYRIDRVGIGEEDRYSNYTATVYSPLYRVGSNRSKRTIKHWEISLADILGDNEGVKISYRDGLKRGWTEIGTFDTAGKLSEVFDMAVTTEYVQIKVQLTTANDKTPNVIEVRAT